MVSGATNFYCLNLWGMIIYLAVWNIEFIVWLQFCDWPLIVSGMRVVWVFHSKFDMQCQDVNKAHVKY